jgi:hypothetical protein
MDFVMWNFALESLRQKQDVLPPRMRSETNGSFTFYVDVFFPLSLQILLSDLTVHMGITASVLSRQKLLWFPYKDNVRFVRYLQLFVGGFKSYLRYLCLFAHNGVQHILCCVFVLFFFILCTLCCQFLWIVLFDCPFGIL